ncbi:MAG: hypothetical protein HYX24_07425 [Candidatus Aenigmarchaeota archaeon]|nr:hypothetical protein [Candidatus Aenigmarchaeota archaeon]
MDLPFFGNLLENGKNPHGEFEKNGKEKKGGFRVGVTSGLYHVARAEELATIMRKLNYTITRGAAAMQLDADIPHEVTYTQGREIRHMAKKQNVTLLFHGDLNIPIGIPERGEWRDAQDRIYKSICSAVYIGAKYVDFHSELNIWLELITYTGRKLSMSFCDHEGSFISHILKKNEKLREWFVDRKYDLFMSDILTNEEYDEAKAEAQELATTQIRRLKESKFKGLGLNDQEIQYILIGTIPTHLGHRTLEIRTIEGEVERAASTLFSTLMKKHTQQAIRKKLKSGKRWRYEELRTVVGLLDGYHIIAHYLFFTKDPIWLAMAEQYPKVMERYKINYSDERWIDNAWQKAEDTNDREFKEFYYGVCAAKFLEGHMKNTLEWMENGFKKEIDKMDIPLADPEEIRKEREELKKNIDDITIGIENPEARDPEHSGQTLIWRPKQIYAAVKTIRKTLKTKKVMLIVDHEHLATQGVDALQESNDTIAKIPDFGKLVFAVHSNSPNPLHAHTPIDPGDMTLYKLFWNLRKTGLGKDSLVYLVFERGGGEDPFLHSVDTLKIFAEFLEKDISPEDIEGKLVKEKPELVEKFFSVKGLQAGAYFRQLQIVRDHAWEPLKDLLHMPDEEWTMLSRAVIEKGRRPEQWKRGEFR